MEPVREWILAQRFDFGQLFLALEILIERLERQAIFLPGKSEFVGSIATAFRTRQGTVQGGCVP
jgi:hypothetical protein